MGNLIQQQKTILLPAAAKIGRDGTVTWLIKGKKKTGKLTKTGRVRFHVDTWTAQFTDETGTVQRISTKTKNRSAAEQILARYEAEVARIKSGVVTREELDSVQTRHVSLEEALEQFRTKMVAGGCTPEHVFKTMQRVTRFCFETGINSVAKIRREPVERWMANEIQKRILTPSSVNHYLTAIKSFAQYLTEGAFSKKGRNCSCLFG